MKRKLKEELIRISASIIADTKMNDLSSVYEASKALYERLAVLKFIEENLDDLQVDSASNELALKFEQLANAVLIGNADIPETNPHEEDIITPGIDTIKDMVSHMPTEEGLEDLFSDFMNTPDFMKADKELMEPDVETLAKLKKANSLNDRLATEITFGLNDRIGFVNHLFGGSTEDFNRVLSQLNTIDTEERSLSFITNMVKPDYNNWEGKEEYEKRFLAVIARKFA